MSEATPIYREDFVFANDIEGLKFRLNDAWAAVSVEPEYDYGSGEIWFDADALRTLSEMALRYAIYLERRV